ncbi:MAG: alanine racemase [Ekhidna sp.]|nr:alanine racemase [Ekhidna sp.]
MDIKVPTLLIDKEKCRKNIKKMFEKATKAKATLRPHFKTHHSAIVASWYRELGINQCTVSSVSMANYFAKHGWKDITIAFPYNPLESVEINALAGKIDLSILLESNESAIHARENLKNKVGYFIKIDVGTLRTGIDHKNEDLINNIISTLGKELDFRGFLAHAGHTYGAGTIENIQWIFDQAEKMLVPLRERFGGILSYGDTPSCSIIEDLSTYDELRPGNFVFYDWMQHEIGSCTVNEIAVCLASPVTAIHPERSKVVIYGGAVHLSKDSLSTKNGTCFGKVVELTANGWNTSLIGNVNRISQEHGIIKLSENFISDVKVGDIIGVIPVHSCLAADIQGHYLSTNGERIEKLSKT